LGWELFFLTWDWLPQQKQCAGFFLRRFFLKQKPSCGLASGPPPGWDLGQAAGPPLQQAPQHLRHQTERCGFPGHPRTQAQGFMGTKISSRRGGVPLTPPLGLEGGGCGHPRVRTIRIPDALATHVQNHFLFPPMPLKFGRRQLLLVGGRGSGFG